MNISIYPNKIEDVLSESSSYSVLMFVLKLILEIISSSFYCPWSDWFGRKLPLIIAFIGGNFELSVYFFKNSRFSVFMAIICTSSVLSALSGGDLCISAMCYSYGTDNSSEKFRTVRFTLMDSAQMIGMVTGVILFQGVKFSDTILHIALIFFCVKLLSITWICLAFHEKHFEGKDHKVSKQLASLFSGFRFKSIYMALLKWRHNCGSDQLRLMIISALPITIAHRMFEGLVAFNAHDAKLFPSFDNYRVMMIAFALYSPFFGIVGIVFLHCLTSLRDSTIGLIGFLCIYISQFVSAFATDRITIIVALSLAPFKCFAAVAVRSIVSKIAAENERGKVFFFLSLMELLAIVVGYVLMIKFHFLVDALDPKFSKLILITVLIIPFCSFVFQIISIHTEHLFSRCYRSIQIPAEIHRAEMFEDLNQENS
ncbi:hypothetical protein AVEN_54438-1 [Araneus ventricosus]|uniref:Solute carrier family 46 member 3 n=1 Tax=Araneus ventricosus TaxID=182803 RepID=A0A4Y2D9R1_ARAVE|nr:hypothetical protein AVEN_54438-1 [Araneus ventricosus]